MKVIYNIHDSLPRNAKATVVAAELRKLIGVLYAECEEQEVIDYVKQIVADANERYPRTRAFSAYTSNAINRQSVDSIVVKVDKSFECLTLSIADGYTKWRDVVDGVNGNNL